ncbi:MAG: ubiquinol-cytochrome c reductase iron-sulfur subunit [Rhodospirillaceae bacterium TMED8]|nr:ubiquinol-cytochrome c reductase iron-sulfur subunit [Magnetovibrio sp.]OUT47702.1 MAG: ubiquinol-cytochrome c reductase iron-sulfur subunit [Rhodospirillaceae bacterium TMED8]|tara:strand:+ start:433 stop:987 length:555 start_codon:yes stop_codon:yes gene_type:complete
MSDTAKPLGDAEIDDKSKRDFLFTTTGTVAAVGAAAAAWPFIHQMNPAADTLALSSTEVDLGPIEEGQSITVVWRGKPVFIRHRTSTEIKSAREDDKKVLPDNETDAERVKNPQWLIMVGVCTHLGCIPLGNKGGENKGEYGGWFCPCHGSHYDTSGRIRRGPAPTNLAIPEYTFVSDTRVKIG